MSLMKLKEILGVLTDEHKWEVNIKYFCLIL